MRPVCRFHRIPSVVQAVVVRTCRTAHTAMFETDVEVWDWIVFFSVGWWLCVATSIEMYELVHVFACRFNLRSILELRILKPTFCAYTNICLLSVDLIRSHIPVCWTYTWLSTWHFIREVRSVSFDWSILFTPQCLNTSCGDGVPERESCVLGSQWQQNVGDVRDGKKRHPLCDEKASKNQKRQTVLDCYLELL